MSRSKKCIDLCEVSEKFTEEALLKILSKACNETKVRLTSWSLGDDGFAKGDNYMSIISKGEVSGIIDGDPERHVQVKFIMKALPKSICRRKTFRCADCFRNEITFYTRVASKFEQFLADKGQSDLLRISRHLVSFTDGENDFIVLEDATHHGYGPISGEGCLDWEECTAVLKTMAQYHAISFAYKDQNKEEFAKFATYLEETFFGHWDWYKNYHKKVVEVVKNALANEYPNSKAEKRFNSYEFGAMYKKCTELCERRDAATSVICEGDCWASNFLIRDVGQNQKEALMLDFQVARCASPILDLSSLIYSCTQKSFRDQYFNDILKVYHTELSNTIKLLGSDPADVYPWDLFMKEVKEQFIFGVFFSLEIIPLILSCASSIDLDSLSENDEAIDMADIVTFSNITTTNGRRRLADVIVDAVDEEYL